MSGASPNGNPSQDYGLYEGVIPDGTAPTLARLDQMLAGGFTHVINYSLLYAPTPALLLGYLDHAQTLGMRIWVALHHQSFYNPNVYGGNAAQNVYKRLAAALGASDNASLTAAVVTLVKDHPAVTGYYVGDEVPAALIARERVHTDQIASLDATHPRLIMMGGLRADPTASFTSVTDCCDMLGFDYYPYGDDALPLASLPMNCAALAQVCQQYGKRAATTLQAFSWQQDFPPARCQQWPECAPFPSTAQMRQQRDITLGAMQTVPPDVIFWYAYFQIQRWKDPATAWNSIVQAIAS